MADQSDTGAHAAGPGALFSMEAADNAEVVPSDLPRGPDSMWSTQANPEEAEEVATSSDVLPPPAAGLTPPTFRPESGATSSSTSSSAPASADPTDEDDAWVRMGTAWPTGAVASDTRSSDTRSSDTRSEPSRAPRPPHAPPSGFGVGSAGSEWSRSEVPPTPVGAPGAGGVFSAEPVDRYDDVVDEDDYVEVVDDFDDIDDAEGSAQDAGESVFSSGPNGTPDISATLRRNGVANGWPEASVAGEGGSTQRTTRVASPFGVPADPWTEWDDPRATVGHGAATSTAGRLSDPPPARTDAEDRRAEARRIDDDPTAAVAADQHGLDIAVARLRTEDQERARVPLSVCGALLEPGEQVVGVVTGQMLGRPAAVVVTRGRVLVVNDRRWQPIVDIYPIDQSLLVRGRHDRQVAALSFADDQRLSMVDGITEVELAIDLAEAVRHPDGPGHGSGAEF